MSRPCAAPCSAGMRPRSNGDGASLLAPGRRKRLTAAGEPCSQLGVSLSAILKVKRLFRAPY